MIYHVLTSAAWEVNRNKEMYTCDSLTTEGFIHCSTLAQLPGVIDRYFKDRSDLMVLQIDPSRVEAEIRYEASTGGELYPHIYGPINQSAIVKIENWKD